jgi:hypothetical protein
VTGIREREEGAMGLSDAQRKELEGIETAASRVAEHAEQAARTAHDELAMLATLVAELAKVVRDAEGPEAGEGAPWAR